jgi:hypothetical protein
LSEDILDPCITYIRGAACVRESKRDESRSRIADKGPTLPGPRLKGVADVEGLIPKDASDQGMGELGKKSISTEVV